MTQPVLRTERLVLEPLADEHVDLEVELDADPEVLRYLFPTARTPEQTRERHAHRMAEGRQVEGLGLWAAFLAGAPQDRDGFVGLFFLTPHGEPGREAELGYRLRRDRWRQGFASEGSRTLLRHAFTTLGLDRVVAQTMAVNAGSRAVMGSVGLTFVRAYTDDFFEPVSGHEHGEVEYAVDRAAWEVQQG